MKRACRTIQASSAALSKTILIKNVMEIIKGADSCGVSVQTQYVVPPKHNKHICRHFEENNL